MEQIFQKTEIMMSGIDVPGKETQENIIIRRALHLSSSRKWKPEILR